MPAKFKNPEADIQEAIVKFLRLKGFDVFAIPNGANIPNPGTRALFARTGLMSGVADLCVMLPGGKALFVEVKNGKVGKQSPTQLDFEKVCYKLGFEYRVWRSLDDAIKWLDFYAPVVNYEAVDATLLSRWQPAGTSLKVGQTIAIMAFDRRANIQRLFIGSLFELGMKEYGLKYKVQVGKEYFSVDRDSLWVIKESV